MFVKVRIVGDSNWLFRVVINKNWLIFFLLLGFLRIIIISKLRFVIKVIVFNGELVFVLGNIWFVW